jgi:hypothetical protein
VPLESDALYECPVCGETNAIGIDVTGGSHQRLLEDGPVCCRPLVFAIVVDRDGVSIVESVEAE